jgi:hypothetical protein
VWDSVDGSPSIVSESVASDKLQENPMIIWPTFEVVLYLSVGGKLMISP